jgi:hypothetical protein
MSYYQHYYIKSKSNLFGPRSRYEDAPPEVVNAVKTPCAFQNPPPGSNCPQNAYQDAPIKFKNTKTDAAHDWTAEMITNGRTDMILGTNNNADVLQYNKDYNNAVAFRRQSENLVGGAKNKKKPNRRTKRHPRRKAYRRRTGKK